MCDYYEQMRHKIQYLTASVMEKNTQLQRINQQLVLKDEELRKCRQEFEEYKQKNSIQTALANPDYLNTVKSVVVDGFNEVVGSYNNRIKEEVRYTIRGQLCDDMKEEIREKIIKDVMKDPNIKQQAIERVSNDEAIFAQVYNDLYQETYEQVIEDIKSEFTEERKKELLEVVDEETRVLLYINRQNFIETYTKLRSVQLRDYCSSGVPLPETNIYDFEFDGINYIHDKNTNKLYHKINFIGTDRWTYGHIAGDVEYNDDGDYMVRLEPVTLKDVTRFNIINEGDYLIDLYMNVYNLCDSDDDLVKIGKLVNGRIILDSQESDDKENSVEGIPVPKLEMPKLEEDDIAQNIASQIIKDALETVVLVQDYEVL